ncbi:MAG: restriction endonuclease subunit S [Methanobacterium sp. ERen5]|nr:MAG: restriction endonuclease subunit S [Methanobacterium sp. ERen5]
MNLKPYPEYKDSGVEWYGQIPENWKLTKLKHISKGIFDGDWVEFKDQVENGDYKLIQLKNIGVGKLIKKIDKEVTNSFYKKNNCMRIDDGNLLIARIPEPILRSTVFLEKFGNCITVVDVSILIPKNEIDSFFLSYLLNSDDMRQMGETLLAGATRQRISRSKISLLPVIIPPKIEQKEIINFLDKKTSEIDKTIQKDTKLIELLKEKRAALINHAVTKGLDPNAKMKDSGVEWIGEIPESANIMPFRRICNLNQGLQYPEDKRLSEPNETSKIYITIKYIHSNREIAEYIPNPPRRAVCKKKMFF